MPTISEADKFIIASATLINTMKLAVPYAANKIRHVTVLQQLTTIISDGPPDGH